MNERRQVQNGGVLTRSPLPAASRSRITVLPKTSKKAATNKSNGKISAIKKKGKVVQSSVSSAERKSKQLPTPDSEEESDGDDPANVSIDFDYPDLSTVPIARDDAMRSRSPPDLVDPYRNSMEADDIDQSDYLLRKINQLSLKLNEQSLLLKERDAEIKRLKSTSISKCRF